LKLLVIFNPHAAAGRSKALRQRIETELHANSIEPEFLFTGNPGHAVELVAGSDLRDFDGLVAAGGDGTLFEVLNGLYCHPPLSRVPLGLIPVGTGNAFARELGLRPSDWRRVRG